MAKRIYVGLKDPRTAAEVSRKSGIPLSRLQQAAAGEIELTRSELDKVERAVTNPEPRGEAARPREPRPC